jgi:hypothetical protein
MSEENCGQTLKVSDKDKNSRKNSVPAAYDGLVS